MNRERGYHMFKMSHSRRAQMRSRRTLKDEPPKEQPQKQGGSRELFLIAPVYAIGFARRSVQS
jgi:hypothetical protein